MADTFKEIGGRLAGGGAAAGGDVLTWDAALKAWVPKPGGVGPAGPPVAIIGLPARVTFNGYQEQPEGQFVYLIPLLVDASGRICTPNPTLYSYSTDDPGIAVLDPSSGEISARLTCMTTSFSTTTAHVTYGSLMVDIPVLVDLPG